MKNSIYKVTLFISCVLLLPLKSQESEKTNLFGKWFEFKNRPIIKSKIINNDIISAMIKVESAGNDSAYNLKEEAVGCLQIRPIMVREVNRILKKQGKEHRFKMKDRWDRNKSLDMFWVWKDYHHPNSEDEVIARNWNGGPNGYVKKSTEKYWEKVSSCLEDK